MTGDSSQSLVTAFVLSYNHPKKLIECVNSLIAQTCIDEILILENFSTEKMEETYEAIRQLSRLSAPIQIKIEYAPEPLNYSQGQNWGLEKAKNELVLLMNNDAFFKRPDSLSSSVSLLKKDPKIAIIGHKIFNPDGSLNHCGVFLPFGNNLFAHFGRYEDPQRIEFQVPQYHIAVTGACLLAKKTEIRFDPVYWFEYEDIDFCFQYLTRGFKVLCNPFCEVIHEESSSRVSFQNADQVWIKKQKAGVAHFFKKWKHNWLFFRYKSLTDILLNSVHDTKRLMGPVANTVAAVVIFCTIIYCGWFLAFLLLLLLFVLIQGVFNVGAFLFVWKKRTQLRKEYQNSFYQDISQQNGLPES